MQTALDRNYNRLKVFVHYRPAIQFFVNTITELMDPHTEYFPPIEKREFDESMSGRFYGIGAQLKEEDGAVKNLEFDYRKPCLEEWPCSTQRPDY